MIDHSSTRILRLLRSSEQIFRGGAVVWWLAHWTSDLKVGSSTPSPCHRVVSLDKILCPTLSLFTQVYKWVPATYCWGYPCDGLASRPGGSSNTLRLLHAKETRISSSCVGLLAPSATLSFYPLNRYFTERITWVPLVFW